MQNPDLLKWEGKIALTCRRPECHPQRCLIAERTEHLSLKIPVVSVSNVGQSKSKSEISSQDN